MASVSNEKFILKSGISAFEERFATNRHKSEEYPIIESSSHEFPAFDKYPNSNAKVESSVNVDNIPKELETPQGITKNFDQCDIFIENDSVSCSINYLGPIKAMRVMLKPGTMYCCTSAVGQAVSDQPDHLCCCETEHVGFVDQGTLVVRGKDNVERHLHKGDCYVIMPGHSCWSLCLVNGSDGSSCPAPNVVLYEFDTLHDREWIPHAHSDGSDFDGVLSSQDKTVTVKSFDDPDDIIRGIDDMFVTRMNRFETCLVKQTTGKPKATWVDHILPCLDEHVNCEHVQSCTETHVGFVKSGWLEVTMDNNHVYVLKPMDSFVIEPGHNAVVTSSDDVVMYGFSFC